MRRQTISLWQVVFTAFPGAVRYVGGQMTRVRDVSNPDGDRRDLLATQVKHRIAELIAGELAHRDEHELLRQQRFELRNPPDEAEGAEGELDLPGFFDEAVPIADEPAPVERLQTRVRAGDISLIEVTDDAAVRTRIYPRSVHCQACGHFLLLDPGNPPASLTCPCCEDGELVVEPIVFICRRCCSSRELLPPGELRGERRQRRRHADELGHAPTCPECDDGHIHLEKHGTNSVARWQWTCSSCDDFVENLQEPCMTCIVPRAPGNAGDMIFMNALPAAASSAYEALICEQMFVGDQPVDVRTLEEEAEAQSETWVDSFSLDAAEADGFISPGEVANIQSSCIESAFLVDGVRVFTTTYGYKTGGVTGHPQTPVEDLERFASLFEDPEGLSRFLAYCVVSKGAALVLKFDKELIVQRLGLTHTNYDTQVATEQGIIGDRNLTQLLREPNTDITLYKSMHGVEHAILSTAMQQIGTEALGSKLFFGDAAILIFERSELDRGGVIQLVNRGIGLSSLFDAARDSSLGCAQGCLDGCPACLFVRDAFCIQPAEEMGQFWLPANSLLSRQGASRILASDSD